MARTTARVFVSDAWLEQVPTTVWRHPKTGQERRYIDSWQQLVGLRVEIDEHKNWQRAFFGNEQIERGEYRKAAAAKVYVVNGNVLTVEGSTSTVLTDGMLAARLQAAIVRSSSVVGTQNAQLAREVAHPFGAAAIREDGWELADRLWASDAAGGFGHLLARLRARQSQVDAVFTPEAVALHSANAVWKVLTEPGNDQLPWTRDTDPSGPSAWDLRSAEDLHHVNALLDCQDLLSVSVTDERWGGMQDVAGVLAAMRALARPTDGSAPAAPTRQLVLDWLDANAGPDAAGDRSRGYGQWPRLAREWMQAQGGLPPTPVSSDGQYYVDELDWLAVAARELPRAAAVRAALGPLLGRDLDDVAAHLPPAADDVIVQAGALPPFVSEPLPVPVTYGRFGITPRTPELLRDHAGWDDPAPTVVPSAPSPERALSL